uniref:Uncharacterized protein n=1 Tax=Aplanochytrium stocchinoi TaxID=215587 RepID=A0A7S3PJ81_9STRA
MTQSLHGVGGSREASVSASESKEEGPIYPKSLKVTIGKPKGKMLVRKRRLAHGTGYHKKDSEAKVILTSMQVFLMFVKYNEHGQCDASTVISKECFNKWVKTRKDKPKCPEESFRRALTAHLVGRDLRRPFPAEAETSILQVIRQKKPWACFEGSNIGVQGFKQMGYHERVNMENDATEVKINQETNAAFKQEHPADATTLVDEINVPVHSTHGTWVSESLEIIDTCEGETYSNGTIGIDEIKEFESLIHGDQEEDVDLVVYEGPQRKKKHGNLNFHIKNSRDLFENEYWQTFDSMDTKKIMDLQIIRDFFENMGGVNWKWWLKRNHIDPSLYTMDDGVHFANDIRYSREFLAPDNVCFRKDRPIGTFIRSVAGVMLDCDQAIRYIQEADLRGRESSQMLFSKLHMLCSYRYAIGKIQRDGKVWMRQILLMPSGRLKVVMSLAMLRPNGIIKVMAQDCSDQFPNLLHG